MLAPAAAQARTITWSNGMHLAGSTYKSNPFVDILAGAYCHELGAGVKGIDINARRASGALYGSFVRFQTSGIRSYAGNLPLAGVCGNPHSTSYSYTFNAHDNVYD